jgi:putative flavoprotein involved in K+ transport
VPDTSVVVVGAGHCGLAMSRCLTARSVDHVVLERGEVANSWRTERWDSLRLLTPNWLTRLPGHEYDGPDPDGYMSAAEVATLLAGYASAGAAPVRTGSAVRSVTAASVGTGAGADGFRVRTDHEEWRARGVVLASGACNTAVVPPVAEGLPAELATFTARDYRNPDQLPDGGVLVVGASASGVQIADELRRAGRAVHLAVGEHVRLPRVYRGADILWWMEAAGILSEGLDQIDDVIRARNLPSMQLTGSGGRATLDLNALTDAGVRLYGRLAGVRDGVAQFSGSLANVCALADLKLNRLLDAVDTWARETGQPVTDPPWRPEPTRVPANPALTLDLRAGAISSVLWATGYRADLSWVDLPLRDRRGRLVHDGGVTRHPGLYVLGMPFLRRRKSTLIDGAADDAHALTTHLLEYLGAPVSAG